MTASEALKIVAECGLNIEGTVHYEVMVQIKSALEKQIPKKPKERHSIKWGDSYNDGECPNCGAVYSDSLLDTPLYCSQCGQRFDWSDENA